MVFYKSIRWIARILSILIAAFFLMFIIGEGIFGSEADRIHVLSLTLREIMMFVSWAIALVGMAYGWKRELSGGAVTIAGYLLFVVINGRFPNQNWFNPYIAMLALDGILFVIAGWLSSRNGLEMADSAQQLTNVK